MTPVLIDTRSWLKFSFMAVFFATIIFATGFFFGYQDATAYYQADSKTVALSLPEETVVINDSIESVVPESTAEGENIDVDHESSAITLVSIDDVVQSIDLESKDIELAKSAALKKLNVISYTGINDTGTNYTLENIDEIKYSIQAGVYGRLSNAEKMMERLKAEEFDAYVSEYINNNNEMRYNVRIGYFIDKRSALPTLYHFRREKNSEAYLVKFSAEAVVDLAYEKSVKDTTDASINMLINQTRTLSELSEVNTN